MCALIIEDDTDRNRRLCRALEDTGYAVDTALYGEDGHFLGDTEPYDVVPRAHAQYLEHGLGPEHPARSEIPIPKAASSAQQCRIKPLMCFRVDPVGFVRPPRLHQIAVQADE